jgi:hypothetical protein
MVFLVCNSNILFIYFKGGERMLFVSIWSIINIVLLVAILGLGIYTLLLVIKALKIYINKNS